MVGDAAKTAKPGEWILGRGWHQEKWSEVPSPNVEGFPLHDALSRVSPNNPVWLTHASGHAGFANALAMKAAEVTKTTPDPAGGKILRDTDGNADRAVQRARAVARRRRAGARSRHPHRRAGRGRPSQRDRARRRARALAKGLTTVQRRRIAAVDDRGDEAGGRRRQAAAARVDDAARGREADSPPTCRSTASINYGDKRFTVRAIKRAIDGALGSRGAWMLEPYADLRRPAAWRPTRSTTSG